MTPTARGTILLADDEEKILKRLGRALRDEGHEVIEASSARDAQRHLAERPFDLFVVDNVMAVMQTDSFLRNVVRGVVIVAAVAVYARRDLDRRPARFERPGVLDAALQEAK